MSTLAINEPPSAVLDWEHMEDDVVAIPYVNQVNHKFFPEEFLCHLYARMKRDQSVDIVFPSAGGYTLNTFIAEMKDKCPLTFWRREGDNLVELLGFSWLQTIEGAPGQRKASIGFCYFRHEAWGAAKTLTCSRVGLRYYFKMLEVNVIFRAMLRHNTLGRRHAAKIGFKLVAEIPRFLPGPDGLQAAVLVMLEREAFMAGDSRSTV